MRNKLKGFTLIEMIIVLLLFSIVMFSVVQLLNPVSKFFVRSSNFESTTACTDNMKRSIEGNLKYADRVRAYAYFKPYDGSYTDTPNVSATLQEHVKQFYTDFFAGRGAMDTAGYIYVLAFDNTAVEDLSGYEALSDFSDAKLNSGKMIQYKFWFNNYDDQFNTDLSVVNSCVAASEKEYLQHGTTNPDLSCMPGETIGWLPSSMKCGVTDWYVNQKLYGNYDYHFDLDALNSTSTVFNPADFMISIRADEIAREDGVLVRKPNVGRIESRFAMANVLDPEVSYSQSSMDTKLIPTADERTAAPHSIRYIPDATPHPRYTPMTVNNTLEYNAARGIWIAAGSDPITAPKAVESNFFYFIYTLPETTYTNPNYLDKQIGS